MQKDKVEEMVSNCVDIFNTRNTFMKNGTRYTFNKDITTRYDLSGKTAGYAVYSTCSIRVNTDLLERYGQEYIVDTVPHEVGHLIANDLFDNRIKPHGKEWKLVMRIIGYSDNRCHSFEVKPARVVKKHPYLCNCRIHEIGARAHNNIRKGWRVYSCKLCKQALVYAPELDY